MNCFIVDDDAVARKTLEHYISETSFLKLLHSCPSAVDAYNKLQEVTPDLIFLDVEMPDMTGLELLKSMPDLPRVILTTSNKEYALDAFEYNVSDYMLKPVTYARFLKAVHKAQQQYYDSKITTNSSEDIFVKVNSVLVKIHVSDILWIEAMGDYIMIHTIAGKYMVYSTLKGIENKLPSSLFIRVHRSFIVNLVKISNIDDMALSIDKQSIPISKSFREQLMQRLNLI